MILTIIIASITFILTILSIFLFPRIKFGKKFSIQTFWVIALLGAIALLIAQSISMHDVVSGLTSDTKINPLKILVLFFSMTFISIFLDGAGLFEYLANKSVKNAGKSQYRLFIIIFILVSILTIFTSNDIVILTFTPIICYFTKRTKINPILYLVAEFAAANTWSMMLIIGNPTNIYLATNAGITFVDYFKVMAVPTILTGIGELGLLLFIFRKQLSIKLENGVSNDTHINKTDCTIGLIVLFTCLIMMIISSYTDFIEMWVISLISVGVLIALMIVKSIISFEDVKSYASEFKRLPYSLIPFVISMFVIVLSLQKQEITTNIASFLGESLPILKYGTLSFATANIINNIPMSILFSSIIPHSSEIYLKATYASIVGSNLGAFLTPIGALAGIMFTSLLNKNNINYSFGSFVKYGAIISIPCLAISLASLLLFL